MFGLQNTAEQESKNRIFFKVLMFSTNFPKKIFQRRILCVYKISPIKIDVKTELTDQSKTIDCLS